MNHPRKPSTIPVIACPYPVLFGSRRAMLRPLKPWMMANVPVITPAKPISVKSVNKLNAIEMMPLIMARLASTLR